HYKKITKYYGLLTTAILAENYCRLHGQQLSEEERRISTWLGIITPLFDDFFDEEHLPFAQIKKMMDDPWTFPCSSLRQQVFVTLYARLLESNQHYPLFSKTMEEVFQSQVDSTQQLKGVVTEEELWRVTNQKGGAAHVVYRTVLHPKLEEQEINMLYHIGGLLQMCNDFFDVYKDLQEGIATVPNQCQDFLALKMKFKEKYLLWIQEARGLPFPKKNIEQFMMPLLLILSRGIIALEQLISLQKSKGESFNLLSCSRSELICDMEKPINAWKCFRLTLELSKLK
ncbi:MAG: class 1 isoprenoid biosynthesis enzyme, partial [Chitinophagaceae bacterium]